MDKNTTATHTNSDFSVCFTLTKPVLLRDGRFPCMDVSSFASNSFGVNGHDCQRESGLSMTPQ